MRRLSAHFILTNSGPLLQRAVITVDDNGTIISVENHKDNQNESHSTEFYNGIIIPGFVNCHCHLELSHLKNQVPGQQGLSDFIGQIRNYRDAPHTTIVSAASSEDKNMWHEGIELCADISNTSDILQLKRNSKIRYFNLLECFGVDPSGSLNRFHEITQLASEAMKLDMPFSVNPHSVYSVSLPLFRLIKKESNTNKLTSIHFMESKEETEFVNNHSGPLRAAYERSGLLKSTPQIPASHADAVLNEITVSGNLLLVHCTVADRETIRKVKKRGRIMFCLCPNSNLYIEKLIPPVSLLREENCDIVLGTDSLASNNKLSMINEIKTIQDAFPDIPLTEMIEWATINGARALGEDSVYGTIEPGKKPGLLLIEDADLHNLKLLPESQIRRLV